MEKKNIWIVVIIILVLVAICCCAIVIFSGATYAILQPSASSETIDESTEAVVSPTRAPNLLPTIELNADKEEGNGSPTSQADQSNIAPDILAQMEEIEREVEDLRGLPRAIDLDRKTLTPEELGQKVMDDFFSDYTEEDVRQDALILNLFGLIERDYDLYDLFVELYSEQIAGFYDDETREMVVIQGEEFAGPERMTYAHEYTHALQDAQYNFNDGLKLNEENCEVDSEYCAAVTALVEGDASFTETQWFLEHASLKDKQEVLSYYQDYDSPIFDNTPVFLQEDLIFPYGKGLEFVTYLFEEGGYAAVDDAFLNPPVTTEQILHPERYPQDQPISIILDDFTSSLGAGWAEIERNTLGEWYAYLMLAEPLSSEWALPEEEAFAATEGWGGDQYLVYHQSEKDEDVLISVSEWDTQSDADEYWQAFTKYAAKRWGSASQTTSTKMVWELASETVIISRQVDQVLWIVAPNSNLAQELGNQFPLFP
jgi:hypothetical protein